MRYFIKLAYDGSGFHGWQIQQNAVSVQSELNKVLQTYFKEEIETVGCGRTDTGVHATCFFAHTDIQAEWNDSNELLYHLNCMLPQEIALQSIVPVHPDAHARFDAISRNYEYRLHQYKDPFLRKGSLFYPRELDFEQMNEFSSLLPDYSDFSCFSKSGTQTKTNICKVNFAKWSKKDAHWIFEIRANRFLRNMVRAITGTLLEAGEHKLSKNEFIDILEGKNRSAAGPSVPAHALYLTDVKYPYPV